MVKDSILRRWGLSEEELTAIVDENPSLRGFMLGYISEYKLQRLLLANHQVTQLSKPDDHDRRRKSKNDLTIVYRGYEFTFEVKSLQSNSIRFDPLLGVYLGKAQVDASDRRPVTLPDGSQIETTCLLAGEFDVLAINLFQFKEEWILGFALNRDLPRSRHKVYTDFQKQHLLATLVDVTLPVQPPFSTDPFQLLDMILEERSI